MKIIKTIDRIISILVFSTWVTIIWTNIFGLTNVPWEVLYSLLGLYLFLFLIVVILVFGNEDTRKEIMKKD